MSKPEKNANVCDVRVPPCLEIHIPAPNEWNDLKLITSFIMRRGALTQQSTAHACTIFTRQRKFVPPYWYVYACAVRYPFLLQFSPDILHHFNGEKWWSYHLSVFIFVVCIHMNAIWMKMKYTSRNRHRRTHLAFATCQHFGSKISILRFCRIHSNIFRVLYDMTKPEAKGGRP